MKHILRLAIFLAGSTTISVSLSAQPVTIPVVFHVVYQTTAENVHDTILQEQLDVLNEDLNAVNADLWKVPAAWQPIIGNMQITFVLASIDPL